ncbi:hypothetical protein ACHAO4_008780 [Trichoderma viride]
MSEFHQFGDLPTEIRLKIWTYALQPINPTRLRAHFFSVTNYQKDGDALKKLRVQCFLGSDCEIEHGSQFCLAAPKFGSSHSWTNNNPSAYLWDFGMWNACCESNAVIEKHYNLDYWKARLRQGRTNFRDNQPVDSCVPFIHPRTGGDWCFPIHTNRDLVCLQPSNIDTVGFYWEHEFFMEDFCMIEWNKGLRGLVNLALEYDPSWFDGFLDNFDVVHFFQEKSPRGLLIRTLVFMDDEDSVYVPQTVWLIDYSLKRDKDKSDGVASREGKVFHGSNKTFVQVLNGRDYSGTYEHSALDFLDHLGILLDGLEPPRHFCLGHSGMYAGCNGCDAGGSNNYYVEDHLQVLACEDAE